VGLLLAACFSCGFQIAEVCNVRMRPQYKQANESIHEEESEESRKRVECAKSTLCYKYRYLPSGMACSYGYALVTAQSSGSVAMPFTRALP
jgi:hypothetical protein